MTWFERITSTLVLYKTTGGADTRFPSLSITLDTNTLYKWLGVISIGIYQKSGIWKQWAYEPVKTLCLEMVIESDSINEDGATVGSDEDEDDEISTGLRRNIP